MGIDTNDHCYKSANMGKDRIREVVAIGSKTSNVFYIEKKCLNKYPNVRLLSSEGSMLSANMAVLASCSQFFYQLFLDINQDHCYSNNDLIITTEVSQY